IFYLEKPGSFFEKEDLSENTINATGTVEIEEVDISSKIPGYIKELPVEESDRIEEGQLLAVIDRPDLLARLDRDRASLEKAEALLEDLRKGARKEEIAEADADIRAALSRYEQAEKDHERYLYLYKDKVVSAKQMEESRLARKVALENLRSLREKKALLLQGARDDIIRAQEDEIKAIEAGLRMTETEVEDSFIRSPISGTVLLKNYEKGELASVGSILLTLGDYRRCWINIYVPSTQLGLVFPGQEASVKVDSYPDRVFTGKISEIAEKAEYTPRASITPEERSNLVFKVKIALDNTEGIFKAGMPADVVINKKGPE
ncbi:MAG TPA: efflux RND transporter periplasmic adaptor subunit, partial [Synergistales bacterium]|nr:efflux RND transporter periplasmic adaptor subunit [Synergistales bacterium]